jgi:predicted transglutaminase-like cysteine proteinase
MAVGGATSQPIGHYEFCGRHRSECTVRTASDSRVHLTNALWTELVSVNEFVNQTIEPATISNWSVVSIAELWAEAIWLADP